ncbi:ATP-dependent Clp protease proteolytic subunit-related protein 4, chloroplastic [Quercus suber]
MRYVKPPIFTLCVGNAWGEAALLLAAGAKGNRSALPSSTIMIKQPIARFQGQASDIELARKEIKNVKAELVNLLAKHVGKSPEQVDADIRRPKYFSPSEAVEYGIIDKVLYNERSPEDRGVVSDLKKAKLI